MTVPLLLIDKKGSIALNYEEDDVWVCIIDDTFALFACKQPNSRVSIEPVKIENGRFMMFTYKREWEDWTGLNRDYQLAISKEWLVYVDSVLDIVTHNTESVFMTQTSQFLSDNDKTRLLDAIKGTKANIPLHIIEKWTKALWP